MTMSTIPLSDPPAGVHSLWRLRGYLRPHALALTVMAVASIAGVGLTIAIPLVTKALIDGPITDGELGPVLPLGLLALGLGVLEAVLIWIRRWVQSNAVLGLETAMRHDLYERLQQLPMSFHTKWQSGQLLSRATTDLSAVQRLRAALPGHQRPAGDGGDRRPAAHVLAPRAGRGGRGRADRLALDALREGLRRGVPPGAGRAGRPGDARGGGGRRHQGDQVLRAQRPRRRAVRRRRPVAAR